MITEIGRIFLSMLVIMDPFGSIPIFLNAIRRSQETVPRASRYSVGVAAGVLYFFLFLGKPFMELFDIEFYSFAIGGGMVLAILALELILGKEFGRTQTGAPLALVGSPILTGPGTIFMTIYFVEMYGYFATFVGSALSLACCWVILSLSAQINEKLGQQALEIISRIMGLCLITIATNIVIGGIRQAFAG